MMPGVNLTRVGREALDLLLPAACAGCGEPGAACCSECGRVWQAPEPIARGILSREAPAYALARYRGTARKLVLAYKEKGRRDLASALGEALAKALVYAPYAHPDAAGTWWLVPVPSRGTASRARGGAHMLALARRCAAAMAAREKTVAVAPALRLGAGAKDAVGLDRAQRATNVAGRLELVPSAMPPAGTAVVLIDDVVTTGATAAACARGLATAGVVVNAVFALTTAG